VHDQGDQKVLSEGHPLKRATRFHSVTSVQVLADNITARLSIPTLRRKRNRGQPAQRFNASHAAQPDTRPTEQYAGELGADRDE
jgi:hypothetical protein